MLLQEIADLRSQPTRPSRDVTPRYDDASADITFGPDTSRSDGDDSLSFMRQRLTQTKKQLTEHMVKMKDLVSSGCTTVLYSACYWSELIFEFFKQKKYWAIFRLCHIEAIIPYFFVCRKKRSKF